MLLHKPDEVEAKSEQKLTRESINQVEHQIEHQVEHQAISKDGVAGDVQFAGAEASMDFSMGPDVGGCRSFSESPQISDLACHFIISISTSGGIISIYINNYNLHVSSLAYC